MYTTGEKITWRCHCGETGEVFSQVVFDCKCGNRICLMQNTGPARTFAVEGR